MLATVDVAGHDPRGRVTRRIEGRIANHVMAVTPDDVRRIANEYLVPDRMTLVVVGDEKTIKQHVAQWRGEGSK